MKLRDMMKKMPIIETERLILREPTLLDATDMFEYTSNPNVTEYLTWPTHQNIESTQNFIRFINKKYAENDCLEWGVEFKEDKKFIGMVSFVSYDENSKILDLGYAINDKYWNKGIVTEAVGKIIDWAFTSDDVNKIFGRFQVNNIGSERVMQKNGLKYEGLLREHFYKNGLFRDVKEYGLLRSEYTK